MRNLLVVLAVTALAAPVAMAVVDYFPVAGDGSFDTYHNSDGSAIEGYTNAGGANSARLGYSRQGHGWLAWDAKNSSGVQKTSVGDVSAQTMAQFLAANPTLNNAKLYINLNTASLVGSYALLTLRSGNQGVIQEDAASGTGYGYSNPAAGITGSAQPWAWSAGAPSYPTNGIINGPNGAGVPWIAAGTTSSHYAGGSFTAGQFIQWGAAANKFGYEGTMAANGGEAWALACLLGMDWSQSGTNIANANKAGQIVNNDGTNVTAVLLNAATYIGTAAPRPGAATGNWYAVPLSSDLLLSLANDPMTKGLIFNNWFAGTQSSSGNPSFVTANANNGIGSAFIAIDAVPEPATMILLALGGLVALRRRS